MQREARKLLGYFVLLVILIRKISRTGSRKQKKMTREIIHLDIADAATVFLTRKIKILPM
jgi:hypothetical protein